jgi:hypothetical protein
MGKPASSDKRCSCVELAAAWSPFELNPTLCCGSRRLWTVGRPLNALCLMFIIIIIIIIIIITAIKF